MHEVQSLPQLPPGTPRKTFERWQVLHGFVLPDSSQSSWTRKLTRSVKITSIYTADAIWLHHTLFAFIFFVIGSTFVGTNTSVGTRQPKLLCLGISSRFSSERVWESQRLPRIRPGVALDKTPSTSGRKFTIGRLTLSILNLLSLMLIELQKSPTSFDSFEKDVSLRSRPR